MRRSLLPQIPHHHPRRLLHQHLHHLLRQHLCLVQHHIVRHGFDCADADEGCDVEIDLAQFLAVLLEIGAHQGVDFADEGFAVELSGAGDLLGEDALQFRVDAVGFDRDADEAAHGFLDRHVRDFAECGADDGHDLLLVAVDHGGDERLLARKILIERADADAGDLGDAVGARLFKTLPDQNASSRLDQRVDRGAGSFLRGIFPRCCRRFAGHGLVI